MSDIIIRGGILKKIVMGILSVLPAALFLIWSIVNTIVNNILSSREDENIIPAWFESFMYVSLMLFAATVIMYVIAGIVFLVYNYKNLYITQDKKIGWGYMIVCIGVVAMPAYWYNFIRTRRS